MSKKRNGLRASTTKIRRLMRLTGERRALRISMDAIKIKQKEANSLLKKTKKNADQERTNFGKRLIRARAKARNTSIEAEEKQLKNTFGQRKLAQRVRHLTGKQKGAPLRSVNAPNESNADTERKECIDKISIEQAFTEEGTRRFSQTNETPLMSNNFTDRVGYLAELPGANEILAGTFIPDPDTDPLTVEFLSQLQMTQEV